jgi:hypothetical protein
MLSFQAIRVYAFHISRLHFSNQARTPAKNCGKVASNIKFLVQIHCNPIGRSWWELNGNLKKLANLSADGSTFEKNVRNRSEKYETHTLYYCNLIPEAGLVHVIMDDLLHCRSDAGRDRNLLKIC